MKEESTMPMVRRAIQLIKAVFMLEKDLQEDEVVCEHCRGTGLEIADNIYGIHGDTTHIGLHFPYKHQSLKFCRFCYNGVQRKCPNCGSLRGRSDRECPCGIGEKKRSEDWERKEKELWENAEKIPINEAWGKYRCLYVETIDQYVFDDGELDDLIEEYELDKSAIRIYATTEVQVHISAESVIEAACENLHDNADEHCDVKSLQVALNDWCDQQKGTATYYPDYCVGIIIAEV